MGDRLFNCMLLACIVTLCLAAAATAFADSTTISEQAAVCRDWREITSPWAGFFCWEHSGFPVCSARRGDFECKP